MKKFQPPNKRSTVVALLLVVIIVLLCNYKDDYNGSQMASHDTNNSMDGGDPTSDTENEDNGEEQSSDTETDDDEDPHPKPPSKPSEETEEEKGERDVDSMLSERTEPQSKLFQGMERPSIIQYKGTMDGAQPFPKEDSDVTPHEETDELPWERNEAVDQDDGIGDKEDPKSKPIDESSNTDSQYPRLDASQGEEPLAGGIQETGQYLPHEFVCTPNPHPFNFLPNDAELVCTPPTETFSHDNQVMSPERYLSEQEFEGLEAPYGAEPIAETQQETGHSSQEFICTSNSLPIENAQNELIVASNSLPNNLEPTCTPNTPTTEIFTHDIYLISPEEESEYSNEKEEYGNPHNINKSTACSQHGGTT